MWGSLGDTEQKTLRDERKSGACSKALGNFFFEDKHRTFLLRPQNVHLENAYVAFYQRIRTNLESQMRRTLLKNCSGDPAVILLRAGQKHKGCWCIPWLSSHLLGSMLRKPLERSNFFGLFSFTRLPGASFFVHLVSGILIYKIIIVKTWKRLTSAKCCCQCLIQINSFNSFRSSKMGLYQPYFCK